MKPRRIQVSFRLPRALLDRIDQRAAKWRAALPGITVTRTDIVLVLLLAGLRSPEGDAPDITGLLDDDHQDTP
jgi:hypothetical protein